MNISRIHPFLSDWRRYLGQRLTGWLAPLALKLLAQPGAAQTAHPLNLRRRYRVEVGHPDRIVLMLVGTGGTGSWTAHILAQLAHWGRSQSLDIRLYFVDPDVVEAKNLVRQNFCQAEVGYPKALTLAWRYSAAFGLQITPVIDRFSARLLADCQPAASPQGSLTVVIGAVDNVQARRDIAAALTAVIQKNRPRRRYWWLDAGNERLHGQVLAGNSLASEPELSPLGFCTGLPLPHLQEPSLLQDRPQSAADLSCAELTALGEQSALINRTMANWLGLYLHRLLQSRDLDLMATYANLRTGAVKSVAIQHGRLVKPTPMARRRPVDPTPIMDICPFCGEGQLVEGQDYDRGILVAVRFCTVCDWRETVCPDCGGELVAELINTEAGEVDGLVCTECDWHQPLPDQIPF